MPSERRKYTRCCLMCQQPFHPLQKHSKYCSRSCQSRHLVQRGVIKYRPQKRVECVCQECGKSFIVKYYRRDTAKYCSRSCLATVHLLQFAEYRFQPQHNPPRIYQTIKVKGKQVRLHRYLMEQHLGRKLSSHEHVHHINGDHRDNRLENLVVLSNADHQRVEYHERQAKKKKP